MKHWVWDWMLKYGLPDWTPTGVSDGSGLCISCFSLFWKPLYVAKGVPAGMEVWMKHKCQPKQNGNLPPLLIVSSAVWHPVASLTLAFSHETHAANLLRFVMICVMIWCYQEAEKVHKVQFTKSEITTLMFWALKEIRVNTLWLYLLGKLQFGAVGALFGLQAHQVGNRRVQEVEERGWQDGNVDVLPLERKQQGGDALSHRHQPLVVWERERRVVQALLSTSVSYERRRWTWHLRRSWPTEGHAV